MRLRHLAALAVGATLLAGCGGSGGRPAAKPAHSSGAPSSPSPAATPRHHRRPAHPPFRIAMRVVTVVDRSRSTPARGPNPAHPDRYLPTTVYFPAKGHAPLPGRWPLVVFAHGFTVDPATYRLLLQAIATDGYVVAAPLFPIEGEGPPGPPSESDLPNQPFDMSAVITAMTRAAQPGGWLAGALDPHLVAAVGHSDGGETVAAMLLLPGDRDPRVRAAVILAGQLPYWTSDLHPVSVPVLLVQASDDPINPVSNSTSLFAALDEPKAYLALSHGGHIGTVIVPGYPVGREAVVDFLDAELRHSAQAAARLVRLGNRPGASSLDQAPAGWIRG